MIETSLVATFSEQTREGKLNAQRQFFSGGNTSSHGGGQSTGLGRKPLKELGPRTFPNTAVPVDRNSSRSDVGKT